MKVILKKRSSRPEENKSILAFAEFYILKHDPNSDHRVYEIRALDVPGLEGEPDFLIEPSNILVEIKGVYDREEKETSIKWSRSINDFKRHLDQKYLQHISGSFIVETPIKAKFRRSKFDDYSTAIIEAIKDNMNSVFIERIGTLKIHKIGKNGSGINFMGMGEGGIIDTPGTISRNILNSLGKANLQLSKRKAEKRVILFVNYYMHGTHERGFIEALSYSYRDLLKLRNIDEIWIQNMAVRTTVHYQVYTRQFLNAFEAGTLHKNERYFSLFERWLIPLVKISDEFKEKCFETVKRIVGNNRLQDFFENEDVREEIVRLGEWYVKNKKYAEVIWVIDKLIDDPDPPEPQNYIGDPQFNYHKLIEEGKESGLITTVLGHLAWLIRYLAADKRYIHQALSYATILSSHKNLYVKQQAIAPLIEVSARRQWLSGYGMRPYSSIYKEFHDTVFYYVRLVKNHPNYKALADFLLRVFSYYKDLSTRETIQVLDALKFVDDSGGLFVYFGLYRKDHYRKQNIEYDSGKVENRLRFVIRSKKYRGIQANIAWHFWQILKEDIKQYSTLETYLDLLFRRPFHDNTYSLLQYTLAELIDDKPIECTKWYNMLLNGITKHVVGPTTNDSPIIVWLHDTEKIVEGIARHNPLRLVPILKKLVFLLLNGVSIGDPVKVLTAYNEIGDGKLREKAKKESQVLFEVIKQKRPSVSPIDWP